MPPNFRRHAAALLSPVEMASADRLTIEGGVSGIDLMENAGQAVARAAAGLVSPGARILVLCGPGNNGGDGFIAARCLKASGHDIDLRLLASPDSLKGDAREAFRRMGLPHDRLLVNGRIAEDLAAAVNRADLIVDALFGAGLDRPLEGSLADIVIAVKASGRPVVAVDLPSGVNGADGSAAGQAIKATTSVTFFREKPGHLLYPGRALGGAIAVADIGIKAEVLDKIAPATFVNVPALWLDAWPQADPCGHKYSRGHALVF
ncbi:MAG: NAD(P)H-hydrate epimerase, partial [Roseibium sp.]